MMKAKRSNQKKKNVSAYEPKTFNSIDGVDNRPCRRKRVEFNN
jgi:hypothetical protein